MILVGVMPDSFVPLRLPTKTSPDTPAPVRARVYIETYGCQMNVADTDLITGMFAQEGHERTEDAALADVILLNTCAIREKAEERVLARAQELRVHKKRRQGVVIGITGCMAEHLKEKLLERAPYVDVIAGPDSYRRLAHLVEQAREEGGDRDPLVDVRLDKRETYEGMNPAAGGDGVSGFITIQRGCDKFCTFCIVPFTRGRERGTPPREILRQARALAAAGYREVALLGQTVNSYRFEEARFSDLLRAVAQVPGIERVRFTSPYPVDFTDDVIAAIAEEPKICKHVHLPLQSGSDRVLARMKRGYTYADFERISRELRRAVPRVAITTDILVGFCGETEEDHAQTISVMRALRFDGAFTFAYSERPGTMAAKRIADDVADEVKKRRLTEVIQLQESISAEVMESHVGRTEPVLLHAVSRRSDGELVGRTDTFKAVIVSRGTHAPGDLVNVQIERATSATLFGNVV
ncbi:MAG: tRNA (N6-isopentenyl adenosine(37)-C2)-methylthiotransferase MiaB [Deltaproteobacteria bacterium]|nr:tRNA (N6-isopentenyl adenosine(37)-C2)-methylthiotransferase MiaB [Deltaproteobacteria bacterium]